MAIGLNNLSHHMVAIRWRILTAAGWGVRCGDRVGRWTSRALLAMVPGLVATCALLMLAGAGLVSAELWLGVAAYVRWGLYVSVTVILANAACHLVALSCCVIQSVAHPHAWVRFRAAMRPAPRICADVNAANHEHTRNCELAAAVRPLGTRIAASFAQSAEAVMEGPAVPVLSEIAQIIFLVCVLGAVPLFVACRLGAFYTGTNPVCIWARGDIGTAIVNTVVVGIPLFALGIWLALAMLIFVDLSWLVWRHRA